MESRGVGDLTRSARPGDAALWSVLAAGIHPVAVAVSVALGLLDAIDGRCAVEDLAARTGVEPRAARTLLEHLSALGIVELDAENFVIPSAVAEAHLMPAGGGFGDLLRACGQNDSRYTTMLEAARSGVPARAATDHYAEAGGDASVSGEYGIAAAAELARTLELDACRHILDVGGGHGTVLAFLVEAWPRLAATLLDLPAVVPAARRTFEERGLASRVGVIGRDFRQGLPVRSSPDAILLSQILVDLSPEEAAGLLKRCHAKLPSNGELIVHEMLAPDPPDPTFAAMNTELLLWSSGRHLSASELEVALRESGFEQVSIRATLGLWSATTAVAS